MPHVIQIAREHRRKINQRNAQIVDKPKNACAHTYYSTRASAIDKFNDLHPETRAHRPVEGENKEKVAE